MLLQTNLKINTSGETALTANLNWVKLDNKDIGDDSDDFNPTTDVFNISSLYGYKLSDKWAVSALGEYRTTLLDNFNDPGFLDLGVGATWTPLENLIVVIHPLNYNFVFAKNDAAFESSARCKNCSRLYKIYWSY